MARALRDAETAPPPSKEFQARLDSEAETSAALRRDGGERQTIS